MAIFNITPVILGYRTEFDPMVRDHGRTLRSALTEITEWLEKNVGEHYGPGDSDSNVLAIGSGWEIFTLYNGQAERTTEYEDTDITWNVDITGEARSVLFALKWIK